MNSELFTYIWQYTIDTNLEAEFLDAYRPGGEWARLFSKDPGYIRTELLQSSSSKDQYMTVDYWVSESARDSFRVKYSQEFDELDQKCEKYTKDEVLIGDFYSIESTST